MGCCVSEEEQVQRAKTKLIDNKILQHKERDSNIIKVLFLGTGESGKSTIFKQMQILAKQEFQTHERENFRTIIRRNMVSTMQELVEAAGIQNLEEGLQKHAELVNEAEDHMEDVWSESLSTAIERLWTDSKILKELFDRRDNLHFPDTVAYFFDRIRDVSDNNYLPDTKDILRARNRTTGINEKKFKIHGVDFTFTDVGGQRNERRKWIHCFEGVTAVMFVVAISEYNQVLYEDEKQCRLTEALIEFKKIANDEIFYDSGMILFLNKIDLLKSKLERFPFTGKFNYDGENKPEPVMDYIKNLFLGQVQASDRKSVSAYFTCGLDTDNINKVFKACQKSVLTRNLGRMGFL